jgi:hypothetical protein
LPNKSAKMHTSRFQSIRARISSSGIRTSFRRSSVASSSSQTTSSRDSMVSSGSPSLSPVSTINSVLNRQPSILDLEEEKKCSGPELSVLEPRPIVYWGGMEERFRTL